jgi:iron complex transport system substrate-binding protein
MPGPASVIPPWQAARELERDGIVRICSLLPSATEIVFALGKGSSLVGVTHECDYPSETSQIPQVTRSNIPSGIPSHEIDSTVSGVLDAEGSLYELNLPLLEKLRPDLILTQRLCDVCAVSYDRVQEAAKSLKSQPAVLNLEPRSLDDILETIVTVGKAIDSEARARAVRERLQQRIDAVRHKTRTLAHRPRVFCMEWVDPPFCGGHWMKELVDIAGGIDDLAKLRRPSSRIEWSTVLDFAPEIMVLTCCGFNLDRCAQEGIILATFDGFHDLPAVKAGRLYATDGSAYFSRPGPRIVESLDILAHLIHPDVFPRPSLDRAFSALQPMPERAVAAPHASL